MNKQDAIKIIRNPSNIRERATQLYDRACQGHSHYFGLDLSKLNTCRTLINELIKNNYPDLNIPFHSRWRHFETANVDRIHTLQQHADFPADKKAQGRLYIELVIMSVLLDAGAGPDWRYQESTNDAVLSRSEGLAIASLDMYQSGLFSSLKTPFSVDSTALQSLSLQAISDAFQVTQHNPLVGLEGRSVLVKTLANILSNHVDIFGKEARLGLFFDYLLEQTQVNPNVIDARRVFSIVLNTFSPIWPGRLYIDQENMGDVWQHQSVSGKGDTNNLVPFHKLSQWLTYSLLEPFLWQGYQIEGLDNLTGLAEYRNGGLFIDAGVITLKDKSLLTTPQKPSSEAIIEWRALTIVLLDTLWKDMLKELNLTPTEFPLVKLLQAGTWQAGRELAFRYRKDGSPPINIISDGTVF